MHTHGNTYYVFHRSYKYFSFIIKQLITTREKNHSNHGDKKMTITASLGLFFFNAAFSISEFPAEITVFVALVVHCQMSHGHQPPPP